MEMNPNFGQSTLRERIVEHIFVGDALRSLWRIKVTDVEILRSEFDAHGYDLVMARGAIVRHIQFKTGTRKPPTISAALALGTKPSGCVIFIMLSAGLDMGPFFWFGSPPGEPLADISKFPNPTRTTPNRDGKYPPRRNHREIPYAAFERIETLEGILTKLFGPLPTEQSAA